MSGFVVGFGKPDAWDITSMFNAVGHRGPYRSGTWRMQDRVIMAQNYLRADTGQMDATFPLPVFARGDENLRICYDGQMGGWKEPADVAGTFDGPLRDERFLLELYRKHGRKMLDRLQDAIFAFVICDGDEIFAARDLLGIKTLFYGRKNEALYLASELKALARVTDDIHEFPPGYMMTGEARLVRFARLPDSPPEKMQTDPGRMAVDIRDIIQRSFNARVKFSVPTAGLLSGGIDSSVISSLAVMALGEKRGPEEKLSTFALGVGESEDTKCARIVAEHLGTDHHELIVDLDHLLAALPEVIYHLESFDPSLVRSAVSNYLISKYAAEMGFEVLLSGEGGDEVFCGYTYLKSFPLEELFARQMECIGFLHNNASLRLDRMNLCNSVKVVAPLISGELLAYAMTIPSEYKQRPDGDGRVEKWIFRKAYEQDLPESIVWRPKKEFSQGSGSADVLPRYFEETIDVGELEKMRKRHPMIRSREELAYFRIFCNHFGSPRAVETVGQWISL